jgi:hypothetical protein
VLKNIIERFVELCKENDIGIISNDTFSTVKLTALYMYYEYYNADETKLDLLSENIVMHEFLEGVFESDQDDSGGYDLIKTFNLSTSDLNPSNISELLHKIDNFYAHLFNGTKSNSLNTLREKFVEMNFNEDSKLHYIILSEVLPDPKTKASIKELVSNFTSKLSTMNYVIFFEDDIEEFITDIDSPSMYVKQGRLRLTDKDQTLFYGNELSLVTSISAKSLKEVYLRYSTKGLFSSNLRYYVKSAKIDSNIKNSIINEPEKFWYFNNGLIITCTNYFIDQDQLELFNFSIVNGGQTTNLVGNTEFDKDFSILCKVIRTKYDDEDENLVFLSKVAEASNTQKPIKTKDIIANRIEQTKLKQQFGQVDVYLQVKRGEKINKQQYPERWQNASNDEIGQMIFSMVYQHPGIARNSKSKMLENEVYYTRIFRSSYDTFFLLTLQHFKVGYHRWALRAKKVDDSAKQGLSRNGFFLFCAVFGFIVKIFYNSELLSLVNNKHISDEFATDEEFKKNISQNDIGNVPVFKNPSIISSITESEIFFDYLYDYFVLPSYQFFKNLYPNSAYSNFTKADSFYYRTVLPKLVSIVNKFWETGINHKEFFKKYLLPENFYRLSLTPTDDVIDDYRPGLSQELLDYRKNKYQQLQGKIEAWKIFTNTQKSRISFYKPRTLNSLRIDCSLSDYSIKNFGEDILKIVEKYTQL